jgi:Icc-related predicted phosphoesterase
MPFWTKKSEHNRFRILFATDIHGSEPTFRKFINAAKIYDVNAIILGGDVTGKLLVPIIETGNKTYHATLQSNFYVLKEDELKEFEAKLGKLGFYAAIINEDEYRYYTENPQEVEQLYRALAKKRLISWIRLAEERLAPHNIRCYITGGNDDAPEVLEVLQGEAKEFVIPCEGKIISLNENGYTLVSLGQSNPTPWHTPREVEEDVLSRLIEESVQNIQDFSKVIFNFHAPPIDSTLDTCPKLDTSTDPPTVITAGGEPVMYGAGSIAVRQAIERYQPLLSLHGHIHESRGVIKIGRTVAVNPGSEYGEGILRGTIVTLVGDKVENTQMTSG